MIAGAFALLVALAFADEDRYVLMPSLFDNLRVGVLPKGEADVEAIRGAIAGFNRSLSSAYRMLDPSPLLALPMDESLRQRYVQELAFLRKGGRAMQMTVTDISIEEVSRLPNGLLSVRTAESVVLRYVRPSDGSEIASYPATRYVMSYLLEPAGSAWKLVATQTLKTGVHGG